MRVLRQLALTVVITLSLGGYAWAGSPTEQLRGYTDQVMKALENPTLTASARLDAVRTVAGQAFDVTETAKRALGLHWQRRTSAEREEFVRSQCWRARRWLRKGPEPEADSCSSRPRSLPGGRWSRLVAPTVN